jgi:hypothetical protein
MAGTAGNIYKLASPTITAISPNAKPKGWMGKVEATGSGFLNGGSLFLRLPGTTEPDANITLISTTVESDTKANSFIMISPEAALGTREAVIANTDGTSSFETFNVTAGTNTLFISSEVWFKSGSEWHLYYGTPETTVNSSLPVTFEVYSTNATLLTANLISYITAKYNTITGTSYLIYKVPSTDFSQDPTTPNKIKVQTILPGSLPAGEEIQLLFYAEDQGGGGGFTGSQDVTQEALKVAVQAADNSGTITPPVTARANLPVAIVPAANAWDEDTRATMPATIVFPPFYKTPPSITVRLTDFTGRKILEKVIDTSGVLDRCTVIFNRDQLPRVSAALTIMTVTDNITKKIIGKNLMFLAPKSMQKPHP